MRIGPLLLGLLALTPLGVLAETEPEEVRLVLNELVYDPAPGESEWIELYNAGAGLEVGGFSITDQDGHVYTFPSLIVPHAGYVLLRVGPGSDAYPLDGVATLHMGLAAPILNDDGDDLLLEGLGRVLDFLRYGQGPAADPPPPQVPWVGSADLTPHGLSLSRIPNGFPAADASHWRAAPPTPGGPNALPSISRLLLTEVLPHAPRDDEYVVIGNPGSSGTNLGSWTLTDGEGRWILPDLPVPAGGTILVAQNGTSLWEDAGLLADACLRGCQRRVTTRGSLALRNEGDVVVLADPLDRPVDAFRYGDTSAADGWIGEPAEVLGRGLVARRRGAEGQFRDTNTSGDWAWDRTFRLGQGRRAPPSFDGVGVKPLLSPEDSLEGLLGLLQGARHRVDLAGFTLTNVAVGEALREALRRGVRVQVGVEASPPGGIGSEGERILEELRTAGARVLLMGSHGEQAWRRYALHHAKYVVVDRTWVALGSENFSRNGYPAEAGNRGWGVVVESPALARWFLEVVKEDWDANRSDIRPLLGSGGPEASPETGRGERAFVGPLLAANVTAHLGPDNAASEGGLLGVLDRAVTSIEAELFYLRWLWRGRLSPLVEGLLQAAARGVTVRILLDGQRYNIEGDDDNDEAVRRLNRLAAEGDLPLQARLFSGDPNGVVKLHNKGLVVDGERAWVSSMNWNYPGAYENREAGLLVESRGVAQFFQRAWQTDWARAVVPPLAVLEGPRRGFVGEVARFAIRLLDGGQIVTNAVWDLHGDGQPDGTGPAFSFVPSRPGRHLVRVHLEDSEGSVQALEGWLDVGYRPLSLRDEVLPWIALGSGAAAAAWWWKLRTTKEPTNKHPRKAGKWRPKSRRPSSPSRRRRSRSTPIAP